MYKLKYQQSAYGATAIRQSVLDRLWREAVWAQVIAETIEADEDPTAGFLYEICWDGAK